MAHFSRMEKYHGVVEEEKISSFEELVNENTMHTHEEKDSQPKKTKLERYNRFLNISIVVMLIGLFGVFLAMFFF